MISKVFRRRIMLLAVIFCTATAFLVYRVISLHFTSRIYITNPWDKPEKIHRGYILDRRGDVLALSVEKHSLYANPEQISNPQAAAEAIAMITGQNVEQIEARLSRRGRFVWLARMLSDEKAAAIRALGIKGLGFKYEYERQYPHGSLAAHIMGFAGLDNKGLEGLEYRFNNDLNGYGDPAGILLEDTCRYGNNIVLTIDRVIQHAAEKALAEQIETHVARQGAVAVLETSTGKIMALAKYPAYDPNRYSSFSSADRSFFSFVDAFEPGSIMKIFAATAWLENHKLEQRRYYECAGDITIHGTTIKCTDNHGRVSLPESIQHSCNVGIISMMRDVQSKTSYDVLRRYGFGARTGMELPGEASGILRPVAQWSGLSKYSIAIGQEMSANIIQLAAAYGAIGNNGIYLEPQIIEAVERADGTRVRSFQSRSRGRVVSAENSLVLRAMLRTVVQGGTGTRAEPLYYKAAGKTGTAQKSLNAGGYAEGKYVVSFAGLVPWDRPELCIIVILDEPAGGASGGSAAAPVFASVANRILPYYGTGATVITADLDENVKDVLPAEFDGVHMPDFNGLDVADAVRMLSAIQSRVPVTYSLEGSGRVVAQNPSAGKSVNSGQKIIIRFAR